MGVALCSFTLMAVAGRAIQVTLSTFELMFWRSILGFGIIAAIVAWRAHDARGAFAMIWPNRPRLHVLRASVHYGGQVLWFYGLMLIPLAQLVAIEFTSPVWVTVLAPFFLGERFTWQRAGVAVLGLVGVGVITQPGVQALEVGHLAAIGCAVFFALNLIATRAIMRHDTVLCVLFWMTVFQTLFSLVFALVWGGLHWPDTTLWPWIVVLAVTGLTAHFALTSALGLAPAMTVAPMEFLRVPLMALVGVWLYAETLEPALIQGSAVIFLANWINLRQPRATK
jgi:drug/metabolite transporter (DMT)-like permease